jgi:dihydrofolate reductase
MRISLVVAASRNGVIGAHNELPWSLPSDLKHFKKLTLRHPVIMGRRTYESIGKPLADRDNIVVTRREIIDNPQVYTVNSIEEAIALAERFAKRRRKDEIMVIGGGQIYAQIRPKATRIYLTRVHMDVEGDTFFADPDPSRWAEVERKEVKAGPKDSADFAMITLDRTRPAPSATPPAEA